MLIFREVPEGLGLLIQDMSRQPFNYGDSGNGGVVWVRAKYLHFAENIRPPYYGTYRSRSNVVAPRRPFAKDFQRFDYDFDSDEEWEDGDGESVSQSDVRFRLIKSITSKSKLLSKKF